MSQHKRRRATTEQGLSPWGKLYRWLFPKRRQDTYSSVETLAMFSIWGIVSLRRSTP